MVMQPLSSLPIGATHKTAVFSVVHFEYTSTLDEEVVVGPSWVTVFMNGLGIIIAQNRRVATSTSPK